MNSQNARKGLFLFIVYLTCYCGFVLLNAFAPEQMERTSFGGLNIAVLYGFALIFGAILLSGLYGLWCRDRH